jgi:D-sedoheptulose 7-phosphate isomerase
MSPKCNECIYTKVSAFARCKDCVYINEPENSGVCEACKNGENFENKDESFRAKLAKEYFELAEYHNSAFNYGINNNRGFSLIIDSAIKIANCFNHGGKLLICGNGGSAADAQHFAAEMTGRFKIKNRPAYPAIALTTDTSAITAIANDFGYDDVFSRQVEALGQSKDILFGISTSGKSQSIINAQHMAISKGMPNIMLVGTRECDLFKNANIAIDTLAGGHTEVVQEMHIIVIHRICNIVEQIMERGKMRRAKS